MTDQSKRTLCYLLTALAGVGPLAGVPFITSAEPYILSMPFLLFWMILWIFLGTALLRLIDFIYPYPAEEN